jgi:hypothetical protein
MTTSVSAPPAMSRMGVAGNNRDSCLIWMSRVLFCDFTAKHHFLSSDIDLGSYFILLQYPSTVIEGFRAVHQE